MAPAARPRLAGAAGGVPAGHRRLAPLVPYPATLGLRLSRAEQVGIIRSHQEWREHFLGPGTEVDRPTVTAMRSLVVLGRVGPDGAGAVDVTLPQADQLAGAGGGQQLELHQRPDLAADERLDRVHVLDGDGPDGSGLLRRGPAPAQAGDCLQRVVHVAGDQFLLGAPAVERLDQLYVLVDARATPSQVNHLLSHCLQRSGAERNGRRVRVQLAQRLECPLEFFQSPRRVSRRD